MKSLHDEPGPVVIRFKDDYHATLIQAMDKRSGIVQERDEFFTAGEPYEVAVFDDHGQYVDLTLPDGSELHRLKRSLIEVEETDGDDTHDVDEAVANEADEPEED
jgi:hypothetical protein